MTISPVSRFALKRGVTHCGLQSMASVAIFAACGILTCSSALAQSARIPPVAVRPPLPPTTVWTNTRAQVGNFDSATMSGTPKVSGTTGHPVQTITQLDAAGILRVGTADIGADATVDVVQPSSTATLLVKPDGGFFQNMTVIEGILKANGQIYIYNPSGIIFGKTSQVNVNSLIASSLKIDDSRFLGGLIEPNATPIFSKESGVTPGAITVEGERNATGGIEQAHLNAARGGKILLIGSSVSNSGQLSAPDGQVLAAAASDKVYLAAPHDVKMRGLLVEVGTGGTVTNESLGKILVERGNATLVGLAVNQNGNISATTSVQANGSIYLRARDGATKPGTNPQTSDAYATHGGTLTLGENSVTEVLPDIADKTTAAKSSYNASQIDLNGQSVHLMQNSKVIAPGGNVTISAQADPLLRSVDGIAGGAIGNKGVYMEAGASIDVSGTTSTELAMESNVVSVELRGTELADVPLQRNSVLRGKTVKIDRRKGTSLANVQAYLDLIEYSIGEVTATGGTVTFNADQEVVLADGALVNVSGGKVSYKDGHVATTQLVSSGRLVDIGSATADRVYSEFFDAMAGPRNFETGYSDGRSAGSINFNAAGLVLRGTLAGNVTPGARQRTVSASDYPQGGQLVIGSDARITSDLLGNYSNFSYIGSIVFGGTTTAGIATPTFGAAWNAADAGLQQLRSTLDIDVTKLANNGFTRLNAYARNSTTGATRGAVTVNSSVQLKPGGELRVAAQDSTTFNADVTIPGGTIEAKGGASLTVGAGVALDVAGAWTNDRSALAPRDAQGNPSSTIATAGGSILLAGGSASVGQGASFDASAGAWQNAAGKITGGNGGTIALTSSPQFVDDALIGGLSLGKDVNFKAYGLSKGGSLKLSARNVLLGSDNSGNSGDLAFNSDFFTKGGFSKYDITAAGNLTVAENTAIAPRMDNWIFNRDTATSANGRMADAFSIAQIPLGGAQGSRGASSLSLAAKATQTDGFGRLWLQKGATIKTDPGATVTLSAGRQLTVDGGITAPGGTVNLLLSPDAGESGLAYRPERSIWLGALSSVDVSGSALRLWANSAGITQGDLLDGGSIRIGRLNGNDLLAATGYVVIEEGARLDVSGASASMTLSGSRGRQATQQVASAGGSIDVRAREGILIEGELKGAGGNASAAGGSISLVLDREALTGPTGSPENARDLVVLNQKFNAGTTNESIVPQTLHADEAIGSNFEGKAYVLADTLSNSGFDRIRLKSQDTVSFDTAGKDVSLSARSGITVDAPVIRVQNAAQSSTVSMDSAYVAVGNTDWRYQAAGAGTAPSSGNGASLAVNATTIDLSGASVLQGFAAANFNAKEDIRLVGVVAKDLSEKPPVSLPAIHAYGSLKGAGALTFTSAQLYPTTMSEFSLISIGAGNKVEFKSNGHPANVPLSAAGRMTVNAREIAQNGVVRAPFGSITFTADEKISFGSTSTTSVAGSGTIPLGLISNGRSWLYDFGNGHLVNLGDTSASNSVDLPEKSITSSAKTIGVATGAVVDLSGGGDLYAYEFTAGPGGSRDVLAKAAGASTATIFAVLPGYDRSVAPVDFQYQQDGGLQAGDRVYLSGIPGLNAGYYTLLPAHYALLPGAYAVSAASGTRDMAASGNYAKTDGTWVVAGYRGTASGIDSRSSGNLLRSNAQVRTLSEFSDYSANSFLAELSVSRPRDGGHVIFDTSDTLELNGEIRLNTAAGGKGGIADISAPGIEVVAEITAGDPKKTGTVKLKSSDLVAMGADSLLLGGRRTIQSDGTHVTVTADNVTVANDAMHPLTGPEVILAARDTVQVTSNSVIYNSKGASGSAGGNLLIQGTGNNANGALLRVSAGTQVTVERDTPTRTKGTLSIASGATIGAKSGTRTGAVDSMSMNLDATQSLDNQSSLTLGQSAALNFGANRISFGQVVPATVDGLRFDNAALAALNAITDISLTSYSTFDLYGSAALGRSATATLPGTRSLSLRGAGIQSYGNADATLSLTADSVRFDGGGSFTPAANANVADGTVSRLSVAARDIEIGSNHFDVKGFKNVDLTAQREVRAAGKGGNFSAEKAMTVTAGRITSLSGADAALQSLGKLTLSKVAVPEAPLTTDALAGKLTFIGQSIDSTADVIAKSGQITLQATGTDGVNINSGEINASGYSKAFGSTIAYAPGGNILLDGGNGNVTVNAAATLDVSATGADAGLISVVAINGRKDGTATLDGALKGSAVAGIDGNTPKQGRFILDVDNLSSKIAPAPGVTQASIDADRIVQFTTLNDKLNAGGFTEARSMRVRHGDIVVADKGSDSNGKKIDAIKSHQVLLAADNGNVTVGGQINASGAKGGSIELYAAQATATGNSGNVILKNTARLLANATATATSGAGSTGDGGSIIIGAGNANGSMVATVSGNSSITLESGAIIDVSKSPADANGNQLGQGGTVTLRAPRVDSNSLDTDYSGDDVAIIQLGATITGSRDTVIEAFKTYTGSTITATADSATNLDAGATGKMYQDASTFGGKAATILSRLGAASDVNLRAGVEVRSPSDLLVSVNESLKDANGNETTSAQDRGWNLNTWRFGANNDQPGILTLRAAGNLTILGSISDGFVKPNRTVGMPGWALDPTGSASWSYRLVGAADTTAANPLNVIASASRGDVAVKFARTDNVIVDQPVALIRTGTGRIDIAAGRDMVLDSVTVDIPDPIDSAATVPAVLGAAIYTAGHSKSLENGFLAPKNQAVNTIYTNGTTPPSYTATFAEGGGAISIAAERDVIGAVTRQEINDWLFRRGRVTTDAAGNTIFAGPTDIEKKAAPAKRYESVFSTGWWSRYDYFNQGIATFGGGDISVTAGNDISNLSLSIATSGQVPADAQLRPTTPVERGGGDIALRAGGDIRGGSYYVQKGVANLSAGGSIIAGDNVVADDYLGTVNLRPVLALGDGKFTITATGNVEIETAFNPTLLRQSSYNADATTSGAGGRQSPLSVFSTYGADSAVTLSSLAGDVNLGNHSMALSNASAPWVTPQDNTFLVYPSSFRATAMAGSINFENGFSLWPSPTGQLDLLARNSISAVYPRRSDGTNINPQPIVMLDAATKSLPSILAPAASIDSVSAILNPGDDADGLAYHTQGGLHANDSQPVRFVALTGDIVGESYFGSPESFQTHDTLRSAKPMEILAGRDIVNFGFKIQHLDEDDVSTVTAGRDFIDSTYSAQSAVRHFVSGPGRLDITAGRDIDLGTSGGIVTRGNLDNPNLPDAGASINLVAGAKPDYAGFSDHYLNATDLPVADQTALIAYMQRLDPSLPQSLSAVEALALLKKLPPTQSAEFLNARKPLLNDVFFEKLRMTSGATGDSALDLAAFDAVIASLYPSSDITGGNINVFGSQLKTARGGSINIFAPGGSVQAGLAEKPAWVKAALVSDKSFESNLGIYTIAGGNLQALVNMDFLVNQGRVFTLGGGDITLVSQYGNIDAGKGAKTSQSTPPPVIRTDANGNTIVDISASITGSGIATLRTNPSLPIANVYPIAPRGIFDAGDAGVRSSGSVSIVAAAVLNASNISAGGGVSGTPVANTSGLSTPAAPANTTSTKSDDIAKTMETRSGNSGGTLNVEVIGFGNDQQVVTQTGKNTPSASVKPDSDDCLNDDSNKCKNKKK